MRAAQVDQSLHDQGAEVDLLCALVPQLRERSAVDVGAERGEVTAALREAGIGRAWLIEPFPGNSERLRRRFAGEDDVRLIECAAAGADGTAELHLASGPPGELADAFHTLHPGSPTASVRWNRSVPVTVRSLASLASAGALPSSFGVLKVDAEGADADVLRGARGLRCEAVMTEFWEDLPGSVGRCPYSLEELRGLVEPLGARRFLLVRHGRRHVSIGRWDEAALGPEQWGNLIWLADHLVEAAEAALPAIDAALSVRNEAVTAQMEGAAAERLEVILDFKRRLAERSESDRSRPS